VEGAPIVTTLKRALWGGAAALALFLSFPHPVAGRVIDLGWLLAWIAPALFVFALRDLAPRRAALWGFAIGWAAYSAILHWIYVVTVTYGHAHPVVGVIAPIALATYIAVFPALFGLSQAWLAARALASPWSAALAWAALDHARRSRSPAFPGRRSGMRSTRTRRSWASRRSRGSMGSRSRARSAARRCSTRRARRAVRTRPARVAVRAARRPGRCTGSDWPRRVRPKSGRDGPRRGDPGQHRPGREVGRGVGREPLASYESLSREAAGGRCDS
jgi:hypothetical protein